MCYFTVFNSHWTSDHELELWHFAHKFITGAVGKESGTGLDLVVPQVVQHLKE